MRVGKYQVVRRLATGGMAEVFLAKAAGPMGFEKTLVVKRILPHLAEDPAFVEMFLSEAKLAAQLNHPNIVQIFDFGEADDTYFLAMEYIDGLNLREIIRRAGELSLTLQVAVCARIISAACEGLAFAHDFWDLSTGQELNIVHRDISPDNILLSRQGAVKVVDFGIAKAAGFSPHTQTGVLKGKLAYMPPEYLRSEALDRRMDVYSLGVVFYELLTGQKPIMAPSEAGMVQAILLEPPVPVEQRRPDVPAAVQRILSRALAKDRENRYPDCFALQEDLEEFILSMAKPVGAAQLAQIVSIVIPADTSNLLPQHTGSLRGSLRFAPSQSQQAIPKVVVEPQVLVAPSKAEEGRRMLEELSRNLETTSIERPPRSALQYVSLEAPRPVSQTDLLPVLSPTPVVPAPAPPARSNHSWAALAGVVLVLAGVAYVSQLPSKAPPVQPPKDENKVVLTNTAMQESDGGTPGVGSSGGGPSLSDAGMPESSSRAGEGHSTDGGVQLPPAGKGSGGGGKPKSKPPPVIVKPLEEEEEEEEEEMGTLVLEVEPASEPFKVLLDGFQVGKTPLADADMEPGVHTIVLVNEQQKKVATQRFRVTAGQVTTLKITVPKQ
jgi:serine/threonine protein kinase